MDRNSRIDFIQVLRGLAALMVVFYHHSHLLAPEQQALAHRLFGPAGSLGVVLFFIISGFIMVHTTARLDAQARTAVIFFARRFLRIWPLYMLATGAFVSYVFYGVDYFHLPKESQAFWSGIRFEPSGQGRSPDFGFPALAVGWTLNYEMYFYLCIAISLVFGRARWWVLSAWFVLTLLALRGLWGPLSFDMSEGYGIANPYGRLVTSPIIWNFYAGIAIGLISRHPLWARCPRIVLVLMLALSLGVVCWQYTSDTHVGHGVKEWGVSLAWMTLSLALLQRHHPMTAPAPLRWLGDVSFSLYLWHPLAENLSLDLLTRLGLEPWSQGWSGMFWALLTTLGLAALSYSVLEKRINHSSQQLLTLASFRPHLQRASP
jgi:peptidoglycan/LPS O-acetylase OafA/YrhL